MEWDDIAKDRFYQRDWTEDGLPTVRKNEIYWSGWWFQTQAEKEKFLEWVKLQENRKLYDEIHYT